MFLGAYLKFVVTGLVQYKEVIMVLANVATVVALIFIAWALIYSAKTLKLQKDSTQMSLFHEITTELNRIISEQKESEEKGWNVVKNWYQRLINGFEYYAFFVNRGYLTGGMSTFYRGALISYVNWAKDKQDLQKFFRSKDRLLLCEVRKYYEKYSGNQFPF